MSAKEKYKDRICNRKHASGYWYQFIFPRMIARDCNFGNNQYGDLYRWLGFYFRRFR